MILKVAVGAALVSVLLAACIEANVSKEYMLRRSASPAELEAFLLSDLDVRDVPLGSLVKVTDPSV